MLRILAMQAFDVMDAWGFDYKTYLVWVKPQIGMGNYFRVSTELVLFGAKGGMRTQARDVRNWFEAKRGKHSAKPTAAGVYGRARRAGAAGVACQPEGSTMTATWVTITDLVTGRRVTCRADAIEDTLLDDVLADRRLYAPAGAVACADAAFNFPTPIALAIAKGVSVRGRTFGGGHVLGPIPAEGRDMSPPGLMAAPGAGVTTTGRDALTGTQLQMVSNAARKALIDQGIGVVSAAKVNRLVRRFNKALRRAGLSFTGFLALEPQRRRAALDDPDLLRVIKYIDKTGEDAVNHVLRQRGY
ncbi:hypothetical protein [Mycobacterium canetti]|uniref:hypothetical protein n=2 Tax=Mycobacterium canetti TaxID=78331 RepID=UPI00138AF561|nr:hypothetical protein [Mycobacterium canetti]